MVLDPSTSCFQGVPFVSTPNCDDRPSGTLIDLLVIHGISLPPGDFNNKSNIIAFFSNQLDIASHPYFDSIKHLKVSAHLCVFRDGSVTQFVPLNKRAWHAGVSQFQDRTACNDFSIGIELQGTDDTPYTELQYQTLVMLTRHIQNAYPAITRDRIVGHSDIAPGRKTDPGSGFDWRHYKSKLLD